MFTTLRSKIIVGFAIIIAINVIFAMWAIYRFSLVGQELDASVAEYLRTTEQAVLLSRIADEQYAEVALAVNSSQPPDTLRHRSLERRFLRTLQNARTSARDGHLPLADSIAATYSQFLDAADAVFTTAPPDSSALTTATRHFRELSALITAISSPESGAVSAIRSDLTEELQGALLYVGIGTLIAAVLALFGGSLYASWTLQSIQRLQQAVRGVTSGELTTKIHITSADELGDLSFEFNRMVERLQQFEAMNLEAILLERRRAETIVQSISIPLVVVGDGLTIAMVNSAALRLFQRRYDTNLAGLPLEELLGSDELIQGFRKARDNQEAADRLKYVKEVEGEEQYYSVQILPLEGAGSGIVGVFTDVTHYKKLDRLKSDLLARVSHEFRTPLSSMIMSADLFSRGTLGEITDEQQELIGDLKADALRLSALIENLLEASRLQSGEDVRRLERVELPEFTRSTLRPLRVLARKKGVAIELDLEQAPYQVTIDREHLRWILSNLVSNAIRHSPEKEIVNVAVSEHDSRLLIEVRDRGAGIPLESQHLIFDRFYQVDEGSASSPGSVGLGLAIVKDVVESYGGSVEVQSKVGEGARFCVMIPIDEERDD